MLTVHGEDKAQKDLSADEFKRFMTTGFLYRRATELPSVEGLPDFYQVAFHSDEYIGETWGNALGGRWRAGMLSSSA